jgi:hypothetical protein
MTQAQHCEHSAHIGIVFGSARKVETDEILEAAAHLECGSIYPSRERGCARSGTRLEQGICVGNCELEQLKERGFRNPHTNKCKDDLPIQVRGYFFDHQVKKNEAK